MWLTWVALVAAPLVLGVVVGLLWWRLAPVASVARAGPVTFSAAHPEVQAAQTGVFTVLTALAGLVCGVVGGGLAVRAAAVRGRWPLVRSLVVIVASAGGVAIAAWIGAALGPASIAEQLAALPAHPAAASPSAASPEALRLVSPLRVDAAGAYLVWPALTALVLAVAHALAAGDEPPPAVPPR